MNAAAVPRVITVPDGLWVDIQRALSVSSLVLYPVPSSSSQYQRYELASRTRQAVVNDLGLSDRELQVLRGIAAGKSNGEIARDLELSEDTVKTHNRRMFRKLRARDRAHAVALGYESGLLGGAR